MVNPLKTYLKNFAASLLCNEATGAIIKFAFAGDIPTASGKFKTALGYDLRTNASLFFGIYESAERRFVEKYVGQKYNIIELGSSLGYISVFTLNKLKGSKKQLVCVEANPNLIPTLEGNLQRNSRHPYYSVVNRAIDYDHQFVALSRSNDSASTRVASDSQQNLDLLVRSCKLSEIVNDSFDCEDYVLICDIEGAEFSLFENEDTAFSCLKGIILEAHTLRTPQSTLLPENLIPIIEDKTGLAMRERYGNVFVFGFE